MCKTNPINDATLCPIIPTIIKCKLAKPPRFFQLFNIVIIIPEIAVTGK